MSAFLTSPAVMALETRQRRLLLMPSVPSAKPRRKKRQKVLDLILHGQWMS